MGVILIAMLVVGAVAYRTAYQENAYPERGEDGCFGGCPTGATVDVEGGVAQSTVTYTATGFSPAPLTVKIGETVMFKNESVNPMWVASAPHPAHTDYPEFDAMKAIMPGESYSFTFNKIGTWKYHNHMNATQYGSIMVTE
ncbi:MAG: Plastocyanin [Candidatus Wolfebacteria bacterium GW2011_GWE2_44_13]|uniref:Plastocyanin n=1 Tax=Candidatus Wolfebacteria bacterium GW2011_GWE2_44_13 TaxID=1619017 RepID=A0A0G1H7W2_9BACT|nr:MAG: Plastocyanin [Candidatus Wolfebacteria bacterium GW2011_GWE2_44_13]